MSRPSGSSASVIAYAPRWAERPSAVGDPAVQGGMDEIISTAGIAQEIQLAVAPVFLLTCIAAFLTVLSNRLGRAVDRARAVETVPDDDASAVALPDASNLRRRIWLIQWAIRLFVGAALLICLVVVMLFVGDYVAFEFSAFIAGLFIAAMLAMVCGLVMFLLEIAISTRATRRELLEAASRREA